MSIYRLKPTCKDYLWGGHKLIEEYGVDYSGDICAEAWVLSGHKDGASVICTDKGDMTLPDFISTQGKEILGERCIQLKEFPLIIKLIDAKKSLSIQVHPDDEYARIHEGQLGKTEMWYVLQADDGAFLYQGFSHSIDKSEFEQRIKDNTLEEVLNKVFVKPGDVVFIEPGTLHSIGAGILLLEVQQSSNVTYRIYDYGRLGADGKPRDLHIRQALDVTKLDKPDASVPSKGDSVVTCEYFDVKSIRVTGDSPYTGFTDKRSFACLLVTEGEGRVDSVDSSFPVKKGDALFVPADDGVYTCSGDFEVIITSIP
ncbi:MAG: class I mannose-6-phosphate isomerase [Butyrivibrio sp.]|nr:class I mannose-6-phosphate isomerase [Butyrivibrio sp.]